MPSISVPTAIIGASVVGAGASAYAASQAAGAQKKAASQAINAQQGYFDQSKQELQPFITGGQSAYSTLNNLLGIGGNSSTMQKTLENLPGYQFTLGQGLKSTQSGYAARGLADSGGALKGAANYATGLANQGYLGYVTGLQNSATTGENAANALAGYGTQTGQGIGSNIIGAGNASAAAANTTGSAINSAAQNIGQYYTLTSILNRSGQAANPTGTTQYDPYSTWNAGLG